MKKTASFLLAAVLALFLAVSCGEDPFFHNVTIKNNDSITNDVVYDGADYTLPSAPANGNLRFLGWVVNGDEENLRKPGEKITAVRADIIITAVWGPAIDKPDVTSVDTEKTYTTSDSITLTPSSGTVIRYTTDGSDPTAESTAAEDGRIPLTSLAGNAVINVVAVKDGAVSEVSTFTLKVQPSVVFDNTSSSSLEENDSITVSVADGVTVYYTTNGDNPTTATTTTGKVIPLTGLLGKTTIKVLAVKDGIESTSELTVTVKIPVPSVSVESTKSYSQSEKITVTVPSGAKVYYTTNGTEPTATTGTEYKDGIPLSGLSGNVNVKAVIVKGSEVSEVNTVTVKVKPTSPDSSSVDTAKTYKTSDKITLTPASGATIRYTTDGNDPTAESTLSENGEIPLSSLAGNVTVKAVTVKDGIVSEVSSFTLKVQPSVTLAGEEKTQYGQDDNITVSVADGVTVYYTTNGDNPTTATTTTGKAIPLTGLLGKTTVKILAVKDGVESEIKTLEITVKLPSPTVTVDEDRTYTQNDKITISVPSGAKVYYTTNGDTPTDKSTEYKDGIPLIGLSGSVTVKAVIVKDGETSAEKSVVVKVQPSKPEYTVSEEAYKTTDKITFSSLVAGTTVHYTTDGNDPTEKSTLSENGEIPLSSLAGNVTVKAVTVKDGIVSEVSSFTLKVQPSVTLEGEEKTQYGQDDSIAVSVADGVTVYYTTNGDNPTTATTTTGKVIPLSGLLGKTTVKILAVKDGVESEIKTLEITVKLPSPTVTVEAEKTYKQTEKIIVTVPSGAKVYYTTNGDTPTDDSTEYKDGIPLIGLSGSVTVKAVMVKDGLTSTSSEVKVNVQPSEPAFTPEEGKTYSDKGSLTLTSIDKGAVVYYTLDGTEPSETGNKAEGGVIPLAGTLGAEKEKKVTIKAFAVKDGIKSETLTVEITVKGTVPVTYSLGDKTETVEADIGGTITLKTPDEREGYEFAGWYTDPDFKADSYLSSDQYTVTGNDTLYAHWVDDQLSFTITGDEVTVMCSVTLTHNPTQADINKMYSIKGDIVIPAVYKGKPVTTIGANAFSWEEKRATKISSVTIPASVKSIEDEAFDCCDLLTTVIFEEGSVLETIGDGAFRCCPIESINLPSTVKTVGEDAFKGCEGMTLDILDSLTSLETVGENAFSDFGGSKLTIPASVKKLGKGAFVSCLELESVEFASGIELDTIPEEAFKCCYNLTSVTIPKSVVTIASQSFYECNSIVTIEFESGSKLETIGEEAFSECSRDLKRINLPGSVKSIGSSAFGGMSQLEVVYIDVNKSEAPESLLSSVGSYITDGNIVWKDTRSITYVYNDDVTEDKTVYLDYDVTYTQPSAPTMGGCTFSGWTTDKEGKNAYTFTDTWSGDITVYAQWKDNRLTYTLSSDGKYYSVKASGTSITGRVEISAEINGKPVTTIEENGFNGCTDLLGVTIPSSVNTLGTKAFYGCSKMEDVTFDGPCSITKITGSAFEGCYKLSKIEIPASVTEIETRAFYGCNDLDSVEFAMDGKLTTIGSEVFNSNYSDYDVKSISIPGTVTSIGDKAFYEFTSLEVFYIDTDKPTSGDLPKTSSWFNSEYQPKNIRWKDSHSVTYNYNYNDDGETEEDTVVYVDVDATVTAPSEKPYRTNYLFDRWTTDKDGKNEYTFGNTLSEDITLYAQWVDNTFTFTVQDDGTYSVKATSPSSLTGSIVIPGEHDGKAVTKIDDKAFYQAKITGITIPSSVTAIGTYAFARCTGLTEVEIPSAVGSIGEGAFYYCVYLAEIEIPSSVKSIGKNAFEQCAYLANVEISSSVVSIGEGAFTYCTMLSEVKIPSSVTVMGNSVFKGCAGLESVVLPDNDKITEIPAETFSGCSALLSVDIPSAVTAIGKSAFENCIKLESVNFKGTSLTTVGESAFNGCEKLSSINLPSSVVTIGNQAFYGCESLTGDMLKDLTSLTTIGNMAFESCGITAATISNTVTSIGSSAFAYCSSLESVTFGDGIQIKEISMSMFQDCSALEAISIPAAVEKICMDSFTGCYSLTSIKFDLEAKKLTTIEGCSFYSSGENYITSITRLELPGGVTSIGENAFTLFNPASFTVYIDKEEDSTLAEGSSNWFTKTDSTMTRSLEWKDSSTT